jgi:nucleoside-diphosphate-sugar epimerase
MIVAVTGGSGFIGRHLVSALVKQGVHVRLLTRHPEALQQLWPENKVEPWAGDVTRPETLRGFAKDADVVFHLAGEIKNSTRFAMVNEMGTKNVLEACRDQELKKFMYLSSVGVIGAIGKGTIDEYTPCHPNNPYEKSKYAGERIALAAFKKYQVPVTVIRPTIVFGEEPTRDRDSLLAWLTAIQRGWFRYIGFGDSVANYVYVGDVVQACLMAAETDRTVGEIYIVSDSCSLYEFVGAAAEFLGVKIPEKLPTWLAYILAGGFQMAGKVARFSPPLTVSRVKALRNRVMYSSDKIQKELGFSPTVGWREGLRRTIAWYKQNNFLSFTEPS